eukprot:maker-scaffold546_size140615-snap-gene-0.27 protein:Tk00844 transcript:maker-scaffold546_size140615-snap-gene-0.27-mRNA-1 annotation:"anthranilate phosphoribosyltransferase"
MYIITSLSSCAPEIHVWSGTGALGSRHHLVFKGFSTCRGEVNFKLQISWGMMVHSCSGFSLGTNLVWKRQVFWGFRSHTSSGTSRREDGILLNGGNSLFFLDAAKSSLGVIDAPTEVDSTGHSPSALATLSTSDEVSIGHGQDSGENNKGLQWKGNKGQNLH